ncbi:MAG: sporulation protein YabP [Firmicutes bacterium]|nr:sporulation protein YabP [Bacillota bacterium]
MAEDRFGGHSITIDQRQRATIDGVTDVISFDEESVICETCMGTVFIKGEGLHVEKLNLDQGELDITGTVDSVEYGGEGAFAKSGGILGRIFK